MSAIDGREETCPDCQATPDDRNIRTVKVLKDAETGDMTAVTTWHVEDCPAYTVEQILLEDGVRRAKEDEQRGREALPAVHSRMIDRISRGTKSEYSEAAMPFIEALIELVEEQLDDMGRYLSTHRMAELLDKHFPPDGETTA